MIKKTAAFKVICAPSEATPQLSYIKSRKDFESIKTLAGTKGLIGFTEIKREPWRALLKSVFDNKVNQKSKDCMSPTAWTSGIRSWYTRRAFGCRAVPEVCDRRDYAYGVYKVGNMRIGFISVHMPPGAYNAHLSPVQRRHHGEALVQWNNFERRINRRKRLLLLTCHAVFIVGDINRPGVWTFPKTKRLSKAGLIYIGVQTRKNVKIPHHIVSSHQQHADHDAQIVNIRLVK